MKFELPDLKYELSSLEPHFSRETLDYHYGKHHAAYVKKLNAALEDSKYSDMVLDDLIAEAREQKDRAVFNNAAQHWNHSFYWNCITPSRDTKPSKELKAAMDKSFGSEDAFKKKFSAKATTLFGSGWTWLIKNENDELEITTTQNAENYVGSKKIPLLTCDMWEHAYYVDYRNDKNKYMEAFWAIVNWDHVNTHFQQEQ